MVEHHPEMAPGFPGSQIREQKSEPIAALSAFERELVHAIHTDISSRFSGPLPMNAGN